MTPFICITCGVQFAETDTAPPHCPICEDERQYVNPNGQQWTTLADLQHNHQNDVRELELNLFGIGTTPRFAIGQRALLLQTPNGNLLWDSISLLDEATITAVNALGGIDAIAISHPHFFSSMVEWSHAFDAPIYLPTSAQKWVQRPDPLIQFWEGEQKSLLNGSVTVIRTGGHFESNSVLHWPEGADGKGAIFTGDTIYTVADKRFVSFMYSYPNLIPLSATKVQRIADAVEPLPFDRIYSGWWDSVIKKGGKTAVRRSATRYIEAITEKEN